MTGRTGRRPGGGSSRAAILNAARARFAAEGYDAVSVRAVARDAGVDPALVHRFFGGKTELFAAAMQVPPEAWHGWAGVLDDGVDHAGERLARLVEREWADPAVRSPLVGLLRGAVTNPDAAAMVREFVGGELLGPVARALGTPDAGLRTALAGSQLIGAALARHVLHLEPLASADQETVVTLVGAAVQRMLTGDLQRSGEPLGAPRP